MTRPHARAWECAIVLLEHDLTVEQRIACLIGAMAGPDHAPLSLIPLAIQVLGIRQ